MKRALLLLLLNATAWAGSGGSIEQPSVPRLKIQTQDGTTSNRPSTLKVTNGSLIDNADGSMSLTTGAGGGGGGGASTLEVFVGPARSSPTASITGRTGDFLGNVLNSTTFQFVLDPATTNYIHNQTASQSATLNVTSGTINNGTINNLLASTFSVTNPPALMATIYTNGYADVLNLYQQQFAGNYGDYLNYQQGNSVIWKIGTDMFDYNCSDSVNNCLRQPFIIKDRSGSPVFSFDQSHRMSIGKAWTPGVNYLNVNGNASIGSWIDLDTAPVNGLMVTGNTIIGSTNAWALNTTAQMQIYGDPSNTYSLIVSTALTNVDLAVSTSGLIVLSKIPYRFPATQASGTQILSNDGSGNLSWQPDATSAGGGDNLGNGVGIYGIATTTAGFTAMNITPTSATVTGADGFRTAFGITGTTLTLTNSSTVAALKITQTGNVGASSSVGGAVNITNTSNTGAGLVIYSNQSAPTDNLMGLRVDSNAFNQNALFVDYRGASNAVTIRSSTTATSYALNLVGQSTATSTFQASGTEASVATFKITHSSPTLQPGQSDQNASAVSIALAGVGTQAQGLFIDATGAGGTTGKLMNIRNGGEEFFTLAANKNVTAKYGLSTATFTVNTAQYGVASVTGNYTATSTATVILADATGASLTVTLPTAVGWTGGVYRVKRLNSGANTVTIATTSAQTIDGASTQVLSSQYTAVDLISDGANWSLF